METVTLVVFTVFTMGMGMARGGRTGHHHLFSSSSRVGSFRHVVLGHRPCIGPNTSRASRRKEGGRRKWDCGMCGDGLFFSLTADSCGCHPRAGGGRMGKISDVCRTWMCANEKRVGVLGVASGVYEDS